MSYKKLLTDRCDIYHLKTRDVDGTDFGIPIEDRQEEYYYIDSPDVSSQRCYFTEKSQTITQSEPNKEIAEVYNVHFPVTADIRTNSKVVWEGTKYKAQKPRKIKNHHIEVVLVRRDSL